MSQNITEKVRKLLNLAEGRGATPGEAANALATAQRLMAQHRLERADVMRGADESVEDGGAEPIFTSRRRVPWVQGLASGIAAAQNCRTYLQPVGDDWALCLVGRASDMQVARYLFAHAHREIERLAAEGGEFGSLCGANEVTSFKWGAAEIVVVRLHLARTEAERAFRRQHGASAQTAIVRVSGRDAEVEMWMKERLKLKRDRRKRRHRLDAYARELGHEAGSQIPLNPGIEEKSGAPARRLSTEIVARSTRFGLAELVRWRCECGVEGEGSLAADGTVYRGKAPENAVEIKVTCRACARRAQAEGKENNP